MSPITTARFALIIGTSFVFLYFGIDKFVHPKLWIGWMPDWMDGLLGQNLDMWMNIVAISEILIGIAVLIPHRKLQRIAAFFASLHLIAILTQVGWNDVAVRDIGLLAMTVALWFLTDKKALSQA